MPPLNLDLLRASDDAEWLRAWDEKGLWSLACAVVHSFFVDDRKERKHHRPQFVEDVALEALAELVDAVREGRVNHVDGLRGMLRTIASNRAIDQLRKRRFKAESGIPTFESDGKKSHKSDDEFEALAKEALLAVVIAIDRPLDAIIEEWAEAAELDVLEKALFREHIADRCTQQDFADAHHLPLGTVGGLKHGVMEKLRNLMDDER